MFIGSNTKGTALREERDVTCRSYGANVSINFQSYKHLAPLEQRRIDRLRVERE